MLQKNLARFFIYLLPCGVFHLFLWFLVTFISHKDVYGYKEEKRSLVFMALFLRHSPSWDCICITLGWTIHIDLWKNCTTLLIYYVYPTRALWSLQICYEIFFFNFYCSIVDLQCWVSFRYTAKWISYTYTYIYSFLDYFSIQTITEYWVEFPVLYNRFLLFIL